MPLNSSALRHQIFIASLLVTSIACGGGGDGGTGPGSSKPVAFVTIKSDATEVERLATLQLAADLEDEEGAVISGRNIAWKSSDVTIATVNASGVVTGVAVGEVTISATIEGVRDEILVTVTPRYLRFRAIAAGIAHTCAVATDDKTWCWGYKYVGGTAVVAEVPTPTLVPDAPVFAWLGSGGEMTTCGFTAAAKGSCWGTNDWRTLGNVDAPGSAGVYGSGSAVPLPITGNLSFTAVNGGHVHMCGLVTGGQAYCWGTGNSGQLGDGTTGVHQSPAPVSGGHTFTQIGSSLDGVSSCGLTTAGKLYCWGANLSLFGDGSTTGSSVPVPGGGANVYTQLAMGGEFTCGMTATTAIYCWGLSLPSGGARDARKSSTPVVDVASTTLKTLNAGSYFMCGLDAAGKAFCWGLNAVGSLGDGTTTNRTTPTPANGNLVFKTLTTGWTHSCGLTAEGRAYCWGGNASGQIGDGTKVSRLEPTASAAVPE